MLGQSRMEAADRAMEVLLSVCLPERADAYPSTFPADSSSASASRAPFCMDTDLLLFDEATSALDPELVGEVLLVMRRLSAEKRTTIVVTHELRFAREAADRIVFMETGRILADVPAAQFFDTPPSPRIEAFLARARDQ